MIRIIGRKSEEEKRLCDAARNMKQDLTTFKDSNPALTDADPTVI